MRRTTAVAVETAAVVLVVLTAGPSTAAAGLHDHPSPTPTPTSSTEGHGEHGGHSGQSGSTPEEAAETSGGVSDGTRIAVLGGFGAVNAGVIATAFVLRGRTRRTGRARRGGQ